METRERRRVLITGGAGFIGSHLAEHHTALGDEVLVLDNMSSGTLTNLQSVIGSPYLHVVEGSVTDSALVSRVVETVDLVYHLAAVVGVKKNLRRPAEALHVHLRGTEVVFTAAAKFNVRTLFTSTSEVYGARRDVPFKEDDVLLIHAPAHLRYAYAAAKLADEFLALSLHHLSGFPVSIVRLFNVTGARQHPSHGMVIPTFVRQALSGDPLTLYGDGTQTRTFCHIHDAVQAITAVAHDFRSIGQIVNVGSPEEISIRHLAELIRRQCHSRSAVKCVQPSDVFAGYVDMPRRVPDLSRLRSILPGFKPKNIDDIIREVIADFYGASISAVSSANMSSA